MSYADVDKVIRSDIEDGTLFTVLLALAFFKNDRTGECYPSTDKIASMARRSPNVVRSAIKRLEQLGYVETRQVPGLRRFFVIHLDRLSSKAEPLSEQPPLTEVEPLAEMEPLTNVQPLSEVTGNPFQKCKGAPVSSVRGPLSEVKAEQGIKQGIKQGIEQVIATAAHASASDLVLSPEADPKPKKTSRRKPQVPCPWKPGTPLPDHLKEWAAENYPTLNAEQVFQEFIGWMIAKDVRNAVWDQAFRNWMANELKKQAQRGGQSWQTKTRPASQWAPSGSTPTKYISAEKQREIDEWYAKQQAEAALLVG